MANTKRRGYGEGSICQRPNGSWRAVVTVGYNSTGKRIFKEVCGKTKKDVQEKLGKLQQEKLSGNLIESGRLTVAQYLDQWLNAVRPSLAHGSITNYDRAIRLQINPRVGGIQLSKLTPLHVQGMYGTMEKEGESAEKRRLVHTTLRCALKRAMKWGLITRNVCDAVDRPRVKQKTDFNVLNKEQARRLLARVAEDREEALYVLAVTTGMRIGELFALEWKNIDLDDAWLKVTQALGEVHGQHEIKQPKTAKGRRRIDLPAIAVAALRRHRKRMMAEGHAGNSFVFVNLHGGLWRRTHFHVQSFKPLLKRAELPAIRFHDLRHTCATLLLQENVHPSIVQQRLGHSQISVTLGTYSHVLPTMQKEAADKLNTMLSTAG